MYYNVSLSGANVLLVFFFGNMKRLRGLCLAGVLLLSVRKAFLLVRNIGEAEMKYFPGYNYSFKAAALAM